MSKPVFVAIEGIDACGKATHAEKLAVDLGARLFVFPNQKSATGRLIYGHLAGEWGCGLGAPQYVKHLPPDERRLSYLNGMAFQALHFTNRLEMAPTISALLHRGRSVVADRYLASAVAYGTADGLSYEWLLSAQKYLPQPDLNILLDIPVEESFNRRPKRRDRYEVDKPYLEEVARVYCKLWFDQGWTVIDGAGPVEDVYDRVLSAVKAAGFG